MADNIFYRDAFVLCKVVSGENIKLDLPFPIYHQTIVENNKNHYCYVTPDMIGKDVLAFIHYAIDDEKKVFEFPGYLGNQWKDVRKDAKATAIWSVKKEDAFATSVKVGTSEATQIVKYSGTDKDEIVHPYAADDKEK
jgi:hypothetical protein